MHQAYTTLAKYYDLIFSSKRYTRESSFIKQTINDRFPNAKKLLDVGCGTGTHLNLLMDDFDVLWGVDLNQEIIDIAKTKSPKINYYQGGMADFNLNEQFDVILCLYSVFNYNLTQGEALKTLRNFKKHLASNGIVVIALYKPTNIVKEMSIHAGKNDVVEVAKLNYHGVDPETQTENSDFVVFLKENGKLDFFVETNHQYKLYQLNEFQSMLANEGFMDIQAYDNFTAKSATELTEYPVFVAQAK